MKTPRVGISVGSANGKGPEMIMWAMTDRDLMRRCRPLLIGPQNIFLTINNNLGLGFEFSIFRSIKFVWPDSDNIIILERSKSIPLEIEAGKASKTAGEVTIASLDVRLNLALQFKIDALVVGPLCFESMSLAGFHYNSLNQILTEWTRSEDVEEEQRGQVLYFKNLPVIITAPVADRSGDGLNNPLKDAMRAAIELLVEKGREH